MRKLLLAILATAFLTTAAKAEDNVRLTYTVGPLAFHAWVFYGIEKGIFQKHNINVEVTGASGGAHKGNLMLKAGLTDVLIGDFASGVYVNGLEKKAVVKTFMILDDVGQDILITKKKITSEADLEGMTLAVSPSSTSVKLMRIVYPNAKFKFVNVPTNMKELLIYKGEVDGTTGFATRIIPGFKALGLDIEKLNIVPLASRNRWTVSYVQFATPSWLENKDRSYRYTKASIEAVHACSKNKEDCIKSLVNYGGSKIDVAMETYRMEYWLKNYVYTEEVKKNGMNYDKTKELEIYSKEISKSLGLPDLGVGSYYEYIKTN